jgi:ATP-dependent helicase HrpA
MNVRVVDASGRELGMDRNLDALRDRLSEAARLEFAAEGPAFERRGLRQWTFGELPETLTMRRDGQQRTGYPALVDEPDGVALALLDTREAALAATRKGIVRLIGYEQDAVLVRMVKTSPVWTSLALQFRGAIGLDALQDDLCRAVADRAFIGDDPLPRDPGAFAAQVRRARTRLPAVVESALRLTGAIAGEYHGVSQHIARLPPSQRMLATEARALRDALVYPGFLSATPWTRLTQVPRYLQALARRIERYPQNPERDRRHAAQVAAWWSRYRERAEAERRMGSLPDALEAFRWMIEELRVSLFAQELRTPAPVSLKRVEKAWHDLSRRS